MAITPRAKIRGARPKKKLSKVGRAIVAVVKRKPDSPQPSGGRAYGSRSTGRFDKSPANAYANALYAPFSPAALGARVPDQWAYPTSTCKSQGLMTLKSDSTGSCSFYLTFNPFVTLIDASAINATPICVVAGGTGGMKRCTGLTMSQSVYAASDYATLAGEFSSYRVVGCGFQLRSILPALTASGKIIIAAVPCTGFFPGPKYLDNLNGADAAINPHAMMSLVTGLPVAATGTHISTSILALPTATFATSAELEVNSITINARPVTPLAYRFKSTNTTQNTFASGGTEAPDGVGEYASVAGVYTMKEREPYGSTDAHGFEAFLVTCEGLPASTNCFDLQYIFHYEGTPNLDSATGAVTADAVTSAVVDLPALMNITSAVNSKRPFRMETAIAASNNVAKVVGGAIHTFSAGATAFAAAGGGPLGGLAAGLAGITALAGLA
jgi:hypothetical protein